MAEENNNNNNQNKNQVRLKVEPDKEAGNYINAVSVHVNNNEVILDLGYLIPNQSPTTIKLVNRVNMSHKTSESLMNILSNAMLDWRNKQQQKDNQ
ncbi:DUF3467 domain-containing protein [Candidatus Peregrinibacteria bacterium]|nr:DUF3467 domain-containing protein [Candidatus Peregrinibacteria bacterium]